MRARPSATTRLLGLGLALCSVAVQSQESDRALEEGAVDESLVVREATLHVRVRTPRKAITGLGREQFRVLLEGRELPIVAFEELGARGPASRGVSAPGQATPDAASLPGGRSLLYVFDLLWSPPQYLAEAVQAARRNLKNLDPGDQVAILSLDARARLLHPFTRDRTVAATGLDLLDAMLDRDTAAVQQHVRELQRRVAVDPSYDTSSSLGLRAALGIDLNRNLTVTALSDPTLFADRPPARFDADADNLFAITAAADTNRAAQTIQASNDAFAQALRLVSDVPGPRYAFLFSTGVPAFSQLIAIRPGSTVYDVVDGSGAAVLGSFQSLSYILQAHGWTVQAIDISGVGRRSLGASDISTGPRPEQTSLELSAVPELALRGGLADEATGSLFFLAEETGGELYQQDNNLGGALRRSLEATSHSYRVVVSLGGDLTLSDRRRTLDVEVSGAPRRARVTHSFAASWALPRNLRARDRPEVARTELLRGQGSQTLSPDSARLGVFQVPLAGPSRRLVVVVDTTAAVFGAHPRSGAEHLLVLQALALPAGAGGSAAEARFHDFFRAFASYPTGHPTRRVFLQGDLIAPCTPTTVRVRLSSEDEGDSAVLEQHLGEGCSEAVRWATPLHAETEGFYYAREAGFALTDPRQNPFRLDGTTTFPALRSMHERGDRLQLLGYASGDPEGDVAPLRLVREDGSFEELEVDTSTSTVGPGRRHLDLTLDIPAGRYGIRWGAGPPAGAQIRILDFSPP